MIDFKEYRKYIVVALIIFIFYLAYLLMKPIILSILAGAVLAYIFYPIYRIILSKIKVKSLSAALVSLLVILIIIIPGFFLLNAVSKESYQAYLFTKQRIVLSDCDHKDTFLCSILNAFSQSSSEQKFQFYLQQGVGKISSNLAEAVTSFVFSLPKRILDIFITFFVMYYLFKDGSNITNRIEKILPLDSVHKKIIIDKSKDIAYGVIYGTILIALIQGAIGALGFYLFGISTPIVWGILIAFLALIPIVGASLVYVPAGLFLMIEGYSESVPMMIGKGIGLILFGAIVLSSIDTFGKPKVISGKARVHPITALIGVIGGIALFGVIGILIGPLILSLSLIILEIYQKDGGLRI